MHLPLLRFFEVGPIRGPLCPFRAIPFDVERCQDLDQETRHVHLSYSALGILQATPSRLKGCYVFPSATGESPLNAKNFYYRVFQPALRRAGIDNFRWHDLRHTFGSRLVMRGADIRSVQELMGHKTLTMTLRYAHLSTDHRIAVVRLLDRPSGDKPAPNRHRRS
jgi:site-specific recombinase XerD